MSEQNPKQNIIRFPLSRRERRQRLLDSKDARIRTTALLRMLCGWALVLGTALFLIANYRIFTPTSLRTLGSYIAAGIRSHDGDITTINYENETFSDGALFESGLAYADSDALFLSRAGSMTTLRYSLGYSDPAVESSTNHVLVYDRGGVKAALVGSAGAVAELKLESTILNGSIVETAVSCSPPTSTATVPPLPFTTPQEKRFSNTALRNTILYPPFSRRTAIRSAFSPSGRTA